MFLKNLIAGSIFAMLVGFASGDPAEPGVVEGHLKIVSLKEVELATGDLPAVTVEKYSDYPLIIRSRDGQKEIARFTADAGGNYRVILPAGNYVFDVQGRAPGHIRAKPQPFTVLPKQTVRVDMDLDTGVR